MIEKVCKSIRTNFIRFIYQFATFHCVKVFDGPVQIEGLNHYPDGPPAPSMKAELSKLTLRVIVHMVVYRYALFNSLVVSISQYIRN